jgi:hypothetical protein
MQVDAATPSAVIPEQGGVGGFAAEQRQLDLELPPDLAQALQDFVSKRSGLNPEQLIQNALAQFLVQHGAARPEVREIYLDGLFGTRL